MRAAEEGEKVVLMRAGQPVVAMVRIRKGHGITLGVLRGKLSDEVMAASFETVSKSDLERLFGATLRP